MNQFWKKSIHSNNSHSYIYNTQRAIIPVLETKFQWIYNIMV